jgi:hypothetical protein
MTGEAQMDALEACARYSCSGVKIRAGEVAFWGNGNAAEDVLIKA